MPNTIEPGEAATNLLTRAADTVARVITTAAETLYDYSGGRYGLPPVDASDVRREREKERERAHPVTVIESRYEAEAAPAKGRRRALPLVIVGAVVIGVIVGLVFWRRRRLRRLAARPAPVLAWEPSGPPAPTPTFERVIRGELLPHPRVASAGARTGSTTTVHDGHSRDSVASEFSDTESPRG